jgi:hypothetical protein
LSFASVQSGAVTDPDYLNVAKFQSALWKDAGHTAITGNFIQGSVVSGNADFTAIDYTLASTLDLENPLPLTIIEMDVKEISGKPVFSWTVESPEIPDHFDLYEETGYQSLCIARVEAVGQQIKYSLTYNGFLKDGEHFFRIRMADNHGNEYRGELVLFKKRGEIFRMSWLSPGIPAGSGLLLIQAEIPDEWKYEIISINGQSIKKGILKLEPGRNIIPVGPENISSGVYVFRAMDSSGKKYSILFKED